MVGEGWWVKAKGKGNEKKKAKGKGGGNGNGFKGKGEQGFSQKACPEARPGVEEQS